MRTSETRQVQYAITGTIGWQSRGLVQLAITKQFQNQISVSRHFVKYAEKHLGDVKLIDKGDCSQCRVSEFHIVEFLKSLYLMRVYDPETCQTPNSLSLFLSKHSWEMTQ